MKNLLLTVLGLVLLAGYWFVSFAERQRQLSMTVVGVPQVLSKFYRDNKRLPNDWTEFEKWAQSHMEHPWNAAQLNPRFRLKWGWRIGEKSMEILKSGAQPDPEHVEHTFTVLDPSLKSRRTR